MKKYLLLLCCFHAVLGIAQERQKNVVKWGFVAGIETQTLGIEPLDDKLPEESAVQSGRNQAGATIGVLGEKKLWRGFSFQSGLSLSYTHNPVDFRPDGRSRYQFADIELPLYFSIANQKNGGLPLRGKILFGPRFGWNLLNNTSTRLNFFQQRLGLDLGLGVEIRLGKLKLCPEAIYSHGMNNLHDFTGTNYDYVVGRAVRDKVAFRVVIQRFE
jgi:Outer membrane protein beta-barrel domain